MSHVEYFKQFHNKNNKNTKNDVSRERNKEAVSTIISSFDYDDDNDDEVFDSGCTEQFINQEIEYKDLASLTRRDLEMLGIKDQDKQTEMLDAFRDLTRQEYSLDQVLKSNESQDMNNQTIECTASHLETMRLALTAANLKLKVSASGDIIVDEKHFASKFVLDALEELKRITTEIEGRLVTLENTSQANLMPPHPQQNVKKRRIIPTLFTFTVIAACASFFMYKNKIFFISS